MDHLSGTHTGRSRHLHIPVVPSSPRGRLVAGYPHAGSPPGGDPRSADGHSRDQGRHGERVVGLVDGLLVGGSRSRRRCRLGCTVCHRRRCR